MEPDSNDGCNITSDVAEKICGDENKNTNRARLNYSFNDYNIKLFFSELELVETVDGQDISPSQHKFKTFLMWELPESYKEYEKNDIPIVIPANTELFFEGFLEDENYSNYSITIPNKLTLTPSDFEGEERTNFIEDYTVYTSYDLYKFIRSDQWPGSIGKQARLLTSEFEYVRKS